MERASSLCERGSYQRTPPRKTMTLRQPAGTTGRCVDEARSAGQRVGDTPDRPSAEAGACSVEVKGSGNSEVDTSCPTSAHKLAVPIPTVPRVSHRSRTAGAWAPLASLIGGPDQDVGDSRRGGERGGGGGGVGGGGRGEKGGGEGGEKRGRGVRRRGGGRKTKALFAASPDHRYHVLTTAFRCSTASRPRSGGARWAAAGVDLVRCPSARAAC